MVRYMCGDTQRSIFNNITLEKYVMVSPENQNIKTTLFHAYLYTLGDTGLFDDWNNFYFIFLIFFFTLETITLQL